MLGLNCPDSGVDAVVAAVDKDVLDMVVVDGGVKRQKMANRRR